MKANSVFAVGMLAGIAIAYLLAIIVKLSFIYTKLRYFKHLLDLEVEKMEDEPVGDNLYMDGSPLDNLPDSPLHPRPDPQAASEDAPTTIKKGYEDAQTR